MLLLGGFRAFSDHNKPNDRRNKRLVVVSGTHRTRFTRNTLRRAPLKRTASSRPQQHNNLPGSPFLSPSLPVFLPDCFLAERRRRRRRRGSWKSVSGRQDLPAAMLVPILCCVKCANPKPKARTEPSVLSAPLPPVLFLLSPGPGCVPCALTAENASSLPPSLPPPPSLSSFPSLLVPLRRAPSSLFPLSFERRARQPSNK